MNESKQDDPEHHDGCLCGQPLAEHEATADEDLPAATGGVEPARKPRRKGTRTAIEGDA